MGFDEWVDDGVVVDTGGGLLDGGCRVVAGLVAGCCLFCKVCRHCGICGLCHAMGFCHHRRQLEALPIVAAVRPSLTCDMDFENAPWMARTPDLGVNSPTL